jgi:hypothetical protein
MLGGGDTGAVLGSGAVDTEFWALVCEDEEWLRAEFEAIVSEPAEIPIRPTRRPAIADADNDRPRGYQETPDTVRRSWCAIRPGRAWRRQRSPPVAC